LAIVDLYGTYIESKFATTGFAGYFCKAIISNYWNENGTE
jgi:20S proteasome subunit beta 7